MKAAIAFVALAVVASAQAGERLTFEVASIRPSSGLSLSPRRTGDRITWSGVPLGMLIQYAYGVAHYQILGALPPQPGQPYDIQASAAAGATDEQVKRMFQSLLVDRFALKLRRETKEMSVLELEPDPKGHRLKPASEDTKIAVDGKPLREGMSGVIMGRNGRHVAGKAATITQLAKALSTAAEQPVIDRTGLTGLFDFDVVYFQEDIRSALQDTLKLRLRGAKAAIPVLVIESIGTPSEN